MISWKERKKRERKEIMPLLKGLIPFVIIESVLLALAVKETAYIEKIQPLRPDPVFGTAFILVLLCGLGLLAMWLKKDE